MSRIKDIKLKTVKYRYIKPFHIANSITSSVENVEIELLTDDGLVSRAEASPSYRVCGETASSIVSFAPRLGELKGIELKHYRRIFEITDKLISLPSLKASIQFACLSAMCNEVGMRVWEFFGSSKTIIETDKTVSIGRVDDMVKQALEIKKEGFKILKIKVGENLYRDIEAVEEIYRKTKGMRYIVDANMGYTPKQAIYFSQKLYSNGIDIELFEQPVDRYDIDGLRFVRFNSPFPVCADESAKTKYDVINLIKQDAVDFVNIKLMKSGISDAIAIIEICQSSNIGLMIGCMGESSLGINASVHLALGYGVFEFCDLDSHLMIVEDKFKGDFVQDKNLIKII
ncbi:MAG: L-Ala-D/L-Glu epimerase [Elusimicrobiales bacterium]